MIKLLGRIHIKPKMKLNKYIIMPDPIKKTPKLFCNYINCQYINYEKIIPEEAFSNINIEEISICENCNYYLYANNHKE